MLCQTPQSNVLIVFKHIVADIEHFTLEPRPRIQKSKRIPVILHAVDKQCLKQQRNDFIMIAALIFLLVIDPQKCITHEDIITAVEADGDRKIRHIGDMEIKKCFSADFYSQTEAIFGRA